MWQSVGASFDHDPAADAEALTAAANTMADLEQRSYSSASAIADALGVSASRVSQMTTGGQLFAFLDLTGGLRYPCWQVVDGRPLAGLAAVLAAIRPGVHSVVIDRWLTRPNVDLRFDDPERVAGFVVGRRWAARRSSAAANSL